MWFKLPSMLRREEGRIFFQVNADAYGYDVDERGNIIDEEGVILLEDHPDYSSIMERAIEQALAEGSEELIQDA